MIMGMMTMDFANVIRAEVAFFLLLPLVSSLVYQMKEEMPIGTKVGNVAKDSGLKSTLPSERLAQLKYSLLVHGYPHTKLFTIGQRSSDIHTKARLDREALCGNSPTCELDIVVGILSNMSNFYQVVPIQINVLDINDNSPEFSKRTLQVPIPESAKLGSRYIIPTAMDRDIGNNTIQSYKLLTPNHLFGLEVTRSSSGKVEAFLILNGTVDRERSEVYQVKVMALDGGEPPKTSAVVMNISVTDVNDHAPHFTQPRYEASYRENTKVGRTLLRVEARDFDHGPNGRVTYHFGQQTSAEVRRVLSINEANGKIKLERKLDYETKKLYNFVVKATDHGSQPKTAEAMVIISVEDVNDNAPSLHFNLLSGGDFAMLSEKAGPGSFICHLSVADGDFGKNGNVECKISPAGFMLKRLYGNEFSVLLNRTLDRETWQGYELHITCKDGGNPPRQGSGGFHVEVMDVNDNPPHFQPPNYRKTLKETNNTNQFIIQVFTTDRDTGDNRNVTYSLESHQNLFTVDHSGIIRTIRPLDREEHSEIELIVVANDNGKPKLSSTAIVAITVEDVNDNQPIFQQNFDEFHVVEDDPSGTIVGQLTATDRDAGKNGEVVYSLRKNPARNLPFYVNPADGTVRTTKVLDRETQEKYTLTVIAKDQGDVKQLSSVASLSVVVLDRNDNDPEFIYPNDTNNTVDVFHTAYIGTLLATVKARDSDRGENATIVYRIVSGNHKNQFKIDKKSGEIFLVREFTAQDVGQHFLFISASDGGNPPRRKSAKLILNIHFGNVTHLFSPSRGNGTAIDSMIIGISLALTAILLAIIIIVTIVILRLRRRKRTNEESARAEAEHMMSGSNSDHGGFGIAKPSAKQPTIARDDTMMQHSKFSLGPEVTQTSLPSPTFSTFTGQNTYMASVDHHNNMTYPQDCGAVNIADRFPPDGQDIEMTTSRTGPNCPHHNTAYETYRSLERDPSKRLSDVPYIPDVLQKLDAHSDISGETTASDSGRGGSEEEAKNSINNNIKGCDKMGKSHAKKKKMGQLMTPVLMEEDTVNQRIKTWMADQHPQHAFFQPSNGCYGNYHLPNENFKTGQIPSTNPSIYDQGVHCPSALPASPAANYKCSSSWRGDGVSPIEHKAPKCPEPLILSPLRANSQRTDLEEEESDIPNDSTRDDDDGATTTSGSYVVSPEDICDINELYSQEIPGVDV